MNEIFGIINIIIGVALATWNILDLMGKVKFKKLAKNDEKVYRKEGLKTAKKVNCCFLLLIALAVITFGIALLIRNFAIIEYITYIIIIAALGPVCTLFYANKKWKKK